MVEFQFKYLVVKNLTILHGNYLILPKYVTPPTGGTSPTNPWIELPDYQGFTTLNDLSPGLYRYRITGAVVLTIISSMS